MRKSMKNLFDGLSQSLAEIPDKLRTKKIWVWLTFVIATIFLIMGIRRLTFDYTVESWFSENDPAFVAFNQYHAQFGSEDGLLIVYKPADGNVFSAQSLRAIKGIRDNLIYNQGSGENEEKSALNHIVRINTLINAPVLTVNGDALISKPLVGDKVPSGEAALERIRETAMAQKGFPLQYFSKDLKYGGIFIETDFGAVPCDEQKASVGNDLVMEDMGMEGDGDDFDEVPCFEPTDIKLYAKLNKAVNAVLSKPEYAKHLEYFAVGNTAESEYQAKVSNEMGLLYLAALVIMIVILWLLFKSFSAVIWPILIVVVTTIWTLGVSGWLGLTMGPFFILTAFLILTVGLADAVHLLSAYLFFRKLEYNHITAVKYAYKKASVSCLLTSITTMIGMAALCFSNVIPVRVLGFMSSIGVAFAFILTVFLLPVMLELWAPVPKGKKNGTRAEESRKGLVPDFPAMLQGALDRIVPAIQKRPITYCIPFFFVFIICLYGMFRLKVDSNTLAMYPADSKFRRSVEIIDGKMAGSSRIALYFDLGEEFALHNPKVLRTIEQLQNQFEKKYPEYVITTSSLIDVVKDTWWKLHGGKKGKYVIPQEEKELSQALFMFNNASPEERRRLVGDNYRKMNMTITLRNASTYEYKDVFANMQSDINSAMSKIRQEYPTARVSITGIFALMMKTAGYLTMTAAQSFGSALIVISIILLFIFGSLKTGLIAILPNLLPSILTFGLLGLLKIPLDFYTMMLAPIIIGISVDDTIHFLSHYRLRLMTDENSNSALVHTLKESGQGIVFTTLVLGLGFGIMSIASTPGTAKLGKFGSLSVFAGLMNDLILLPALIMIFQSKADKQHVNV
ncbi:MAG: MMPL family transporter [Chitinivibrionales bacterium]|nr:MMPL family transporter [Chitinivibrionales bacterium]